MVICHLPLWMYPAMNCALGKKTWALGLAGASLHTNQKLASRSPGLSCLITREDLIHATIIIMVICHLPLWMYPAMNCALGKKTRALGLAGASLHTNQKLASR